MSSTVCSTAKPRKCERPQSEGHRPGCLRNCSERHGAGRWPRDAIAAGSSNTEAAGWYQSRQRGEQSAKKPISAPPRTRSSTRRSPGRCRQACHWPTPPGSSGPLSRRWKAFICIITRIFRRQRRRRSTMQKDDYERVSWRPPTNSAQRPRFRGAKCLKYWSE